jgi:hypothetical protein
VRQNGKRRNAYKLRCGNMEEIATVKAHIQTWDNIKIDLKCNSMEGLD